MEMPQLEFPSADGSSMKYLRDAMVETVMSSSLEILGAPPHADRKHDSGPKPKDRAALKAELVESVKDHLQSLLELDPELEEDRAKMQEPCRSLRQWQKDLEYSIQSIQNVPLHSATWNLTEMSEGLPILDLAFNALCRSRVDFEWAGITVSKREESIRELKAELAEARAALTSQTGTTESADAEAMGTSAATGTE